MAFFPAIAKFLGGGLLDGVLDKLIPDLDARRQAKADITLALIDSVKESDDKQGAINLADAQASNWWQSGWRPAFGWVGAYSLFTYYAVKPTIILGMWAYECYTTGVLTDPPLEAIDSNMWALMFGILGLGSLRTYEKSQRLVK